VSGFTFEVPDGTGHAPTPRSGTYTRERDGGPASVLRADDYPVTAECQGCGGRIRLAQLMQWAWAHVPARPAVPGAPAEAAGEAS
jgi:hypothetical protein